MFHHVSNKDFPVEIRKPHSPTPSPYLNAIFPAVIFPITPQRRDEIARYLAAFGYSSLFTDPSIDWDWPDSGKPLRNWLRHQSFHIDFLSKSTTHSARTSRRFRLNFTAFPCKMDILYVLGDLIFIRTMTQQTSDRILGNLLISGFRNPW